MKTIIHVGLHKTASTYLQTNVFPFLKTYQYVSRPYTQHNYAFNQMQYADDSFYVKADMINEIEKFEKGNVLFSDESFSGKPVSFGYVNRTMIANRLSELFPDGEIVLFLRGQKDILRSQYNMWVKGYTEGARSIDDFIWFPEKNYSYDEYVKNTGVDMDSLYWNTNKDYVHLDCYKFYELISMYKSLFKHVHVFLYEDFVKDKEVVLVRLEEILGEPISGRKNTSNERVNVSLKGGALAKKMFYNQFKLMELPRVFKMALYKYISRKKSVNVEEYIHEVTQGYYNENNRKIITDYPEIGLNRYPNSYNC